MTEAFLMTLCGMLAGLFINIVGSIVLVVVIVFFLRSKTEHKIDSTASTIITMVLASALLFVMWLTATVNLVLFFNLLHNAQVFR
jgi:hypothetical protein